MKLGSFARLTVVIAGTSGALGALGALGCGNTVVGTGGDAGPETGVEPPPPPLLRADKVDLLFMIDNSASMGDKQAILADAVPSLLTGLVRPPCVDPQTGAPRANGAQADPDGNRANGWNCPPGTEPLIRPVTDMHIGIISSSLGTMGGDVCPDTGRTNDRAHLLNLVKGGGTAAETAPAGFLSWYPTTEDNLDTARHPTPPTPPIKDLAQLASSFQNLVTGVDQTGCGFEAQLESVYRFLVQPDPWVKVSLDAANQADLGAPSEVDYELLQQRADFLREDSVVAVITLTDEDDSSADPLSVGGQGWAFMANQFPGSKVFRADGKTTTAPRATSICATDPGSPDCTSCALGASCNVAEAACQRLRADPECQKNGGFYGPAEDQLNVRFHRMKERFGIDPQFPIQRYVDGFTKSKVPDRSAEHPSKPRDNPSLGRDIGAYQGGGTCTNPLFATSLPRHAGEELCNLPRSSRNPGLIFFAVIGGVPNSLLHFRPGDADGSRLTDDDWNTILGRDPGAFNFEGIDPHMIATTLPRPGIPSPSDVRGDNGSPTDPVGRDWKTGADDLQYACTFDLPVPRQCTAQDPSCDCAGPSNPPLCGATAGKQIKAKAYPTSRELMVVRGLGDQGVASSLCPITLSGDKQSPEYGYNPAVASIIDRVRGSLAP
ncbi:MAG TPA: hypothetical protein VLT33_24270 [Labilithrix sp.]|nr:hypothetical protein [Labilithrix sp.]